MQASSPLVSVIISAYNNEQFIKESIASILGQTYNNIEVLIADDGSTDGTRAILNQLEKEDNRIKCFHNSRNLGLMLTRKKLIDFAKGKYIAFQDTDDISYPKRIELLVKELEEHPELALCGANFKRPFPNWGLEYVSSFPLSHAEICKSIANGIVPFIGSVLLIRRHIFFEIGYRDFFDRRGWEDYDFILRVAERYQVGNINEVLYEYRYFPTSASKINENETDFKKYFIADIGFFLAEQRRRNDGLDGLMLGGDKVSFDCFLADLEKKFIRDESMPIRRIVMNRVANKHFSDSLCLIKKGILLNPSKLENWKLGYFWFTALLRTTLKYILNLFKTKYSACEILRSNNNI